MGKLTLAGILAAVALLLACAKKAQESKGTSNPEFKVDFLFEHEGCRMYRFADDGRYRYFTSCGGTVSWSETHHCGKNCTRTEDHEIPTVEVKK